jgi:hypothetical protein
MANPKVALVTAIAALLAIPGAAYAIDPGVNYDPGSPAGKEYAIPLVEGRSDAAGTTDQQKGANIPFGVGIKPPGGKGGGKGDASGSGAGKGSTGSARDEVQGARPGESREELAARMAHAEDPGGTAARTILLALAVLGPAGFLALLLMQRSQASRTGRTA